jgi:hypothetical protein
VRLDEPPTHIASIVGVTDKMGAGLTVTVFVPVQPAPLVPVTVKVVVVTVDVAVTLAPVDAVSPTVGVQA